MQALTNWFIRNPVTANLVMLLILAAGYLSVKGMRIEGFPKQAADTVIIDTSYIGASTQQIDELVTQKIENALEGLNGVKSIKSISFSDGSQVRVQKNTGHSLQKLLDEVRLRVDGISTLPRNAERPTIRRNEFDFPAMYIMLHGQTDERTLQQLAKSLKDSLLDQPEISKLNLLGIKKPEIHIGIDPQLLESYGLTVEDVAQAIRQSSLRSTSGLLKTKGAHILLQADSQAYYKTDFSSISVIENSDGTRLLLGDIATIEDRYEDDETLVRLNGEPAIGMELLIGRKENLLTIAEVVDEVIEKTTAQLPAEVSIAIFGDSSSYISERLSLLKENAIQGLFLVIILLALFLNTKLALWVSMGIPISIAGALALMGTQWIDYSLNDITTFGFIIALGILVDDAVVVGESVFNERGNHRDPIIGTEQGVKKVATAATFGVLTTVCAFLPLLMIKEGLGQVLVPFSGVVILTLLFSLFESKFILPAHLAYIDIEPRRPKNFSSRFWRVCQDFAQNVLLKFRDRVYAPALVWSINHRYAVLIAFISVAMLGLGMIAKGKIKSVFLPDVPGQIITITMEMDPRAPYQLTLDNMVEIERVGNLINAEYVADGRIAALPIETMLKLVSGAYQGEIYAELLPVNERADITTNEVVSLWRERIGQLDGVINLNFSATESGASNGIEIHLFGADDVALKNASEDFISRLAKIDGVHNLRDSLKGGQPEIRFVLKPQAHHLGFTEQDLAFEISSRFSDFEVQRIQRSGDEVKVFIGNDANHRRTLDDLIQTRVRNQQGQWFPVLAIADIESSYADTYLERRNGKRVNTIQAQIDQSVVSRDEIGQAIYQQIKPELTKLYPSVEIKPGGELAEIETLKGNLVRALILISLMIYVLMAVPLKSYMQPFIIMSVVPFGFVGAAAGHYLMNVPLSLLSFFGMLALTGIVVNDSLVLMTRFNQEKSQGAELLEALKNSGVKRFRAVFLTTTTTVAGLLPLMAESSEQAQYLIPAAISLAYGEIFATLITLILIPVLIAITHDIGQFLKQDQTELNSYST